MFTTRPELLGTFGAVTSTHWLASATGMAILERGGNAFDAAVATGFALQVVEPHLNGPAGEVPVIFYSAAERRVRVLCGQGTAPAGATIEHYRRLRLDLVPGTGLLATVVPGAFDAWMLLLRDHGTMRPRDVLGPAIALARTGYPLLAAISESIASVRALFEAEWPTSAAVYLPGGAVPEPGRLFRNPALADTYERLGEEGEAAGSDRVAQIEAARRAFYGGFVAEAMGRFCAGGEVMDVTGRRHRGVLTADDLARWEASYEDPLTYGYHGWTVCKTGPWGQGPLFLQWLALLKGFDLAAMDPTGPEFVHTVVEAGKLAFADREAFYGDPKFTAVPLDTLLSDAYNGERRRLIGQTASFELRPGTVPGYGGPVEHAFRVPEEVGPGGGEPTFRFSSRPERDTCHLDVVDRRGNVVAATPSGGWLDGSPVIPPLGFGLNSRAQMFWLDEDHPNGLAPGKRPRTTLTPSLALHDDGRVLAFGTPGGDQQDQWSIALFLRHVHHGRNLQEAIDAPMFHTAHARSSFYPRAAQPGHLALEGRFPRATVEELRRRGHGVERHEDWALGRLTAAGRDADGLIRAAATPRLMQAYAIAR